MKKESMVEVRGAWVEGNRSSYQKKEKRERERERGGRKEAGGEARGVLEFMFAYLMSKLGWL
jgi:hypothetical protein